MVGCFLTSAKVKSQGNLSKNQLLKITKFHSDLEKYTKKNAPELFEMLTKLTETENAFLSDVQRFEKFKLSLPEHQPTMLNPRRKFRVNGSDKEYIIFRTSGNNNNCGFYSLFGIDESHPASGNTKIRNLAVKHLIDVAD